MKKSLIIVIAIVVTAALSSIVTVVAINAQRESKTSFYEVTDHLQKGGSLYLYLSTKEGISALKKQIKSLQKVFSNLPVATPENKKMIDKGAEFLSRLFSQSGISQISGIGLSSKKAKSGLYENRIFIHHYPQKKEGKLWTIFGTKPHTLNSLNFLPSDTIIAAFTDIDTNGIWKWITSDLKSSKIPELQQKFSEALNAATAIGIDINKLLSSTNGQIGIVITMDKQKSTTIPLGKDKAIKIPQPAVMIAIKVKDSTIFDLIQSKLIFSQNNIMNLATRTDSKGKKCLKLKMGIPYVPGTAAVVQSEGYLFIASNLDIINKALAVYLGKAKGVTDTLEFQTLAKNIPLSGNSFKFISPRIGKIITEIQKTNPLMKNDALAQNSKIGLFSVSSTLKDGILCRSISTHGLAAPFLAGVTLVPAGVMAATLMPTLNKARNRARAISNTNRLRRIGLACIMYAQNNNNHYPRNVSQLTPKYVSADNLNALDGTPFRIIDKNITIDSGTDEPVIIDTSVSGFSNTLYADGHVVCE